MESRGFTRFGELELLRKLRDSVHCYFYAYYSTGERVEKIRELETARSVMLQRLYAIEVEFPRQARESDHPPLYPLVYGFRLVFDHIPWTIGHAETMGGRRIEIGPWTRDERSLVVPAVLIQDRAPVENMIGGGE